MRLSTNKSAAKTASENTTIQSRFSVTSIWPTSIEPDIQDGLPTSRLLGPKMVRTACWRIRLTPHVASRVSRGRPYRKRMMPRSMARPTSAATRKASGSAISSDTSNRCGAEARIASCTAKVV